MIKKIFVEGADCTGKTTIAKAIHKNVSKHNIQKSTLILCSEVFEKNKSWMTDIADVFNSFIDCNQPCNDITFLDTSLHIFDRSPFADIIRKGEKSRFLMDGFFKNMYSAICQSNDLFIFTTNVSYDAYKKYSLQKKISGVKTDYFDFLSEAEFYEFQHFILKTALEKGVRNYIIIDENYINCDEPIRKIFG